MRPALRTILFRQTLYQQLLAQLSSGAAIYDPSDLTSLYQSRTGGSTGAVDAVVGIMLDKRQMRGLSAASFIAGQTNLVANSDFDTDLTGWTVTTAGQTVEVVGGRLHIVTDGTGCGVRQDVLTNGNWYQVTIDYEAVSGSLKVDLGATAALSTTGTHTFVLRATSGASFFIYRNSGAAEGYVNSVRVRELPGYHALAPSDAARPILRSASGKNYLDADGTDDWMQIFPTLNLGEQWWHVGGWQADTSNTYAFSLSAVTGGKGAVVYSSNRWQWRNAADSAFESLAGSEPSVPHVLTIEDDTNIAGRFNGVSGTPFAPYDDSASAQGLALFSSRNSAFSVGLDGRFYGGIWTPGALSPSLRSLCERWAASKCGVVL